MNDNILDMLRRRGLVGDEQITNEKIREAKQKKTQALYHNTYMCLKHYRDIVWALECFPAQLAEELERPLGDLDALLDAVDLERGMDNVRLKNRLKSIQKSRLLLDRVNDALTVLKKKPGDGELMYSILRETFLIPEKLTHADIIYRLNISTRHYYRLRTQAINILSIRLWSSPVAELDSWLEVLVLLEVV